MPPTTLCNYREQAGMTQAALASALGISQDYYALCETGVCRVSPRIVLELQHRYGWVVIPQQPRKRTRDFRPHTPNPDAQAKAELIAMMALCVYRGPLPRKWRQDVQLHRKAICEWFRQLGDREREAAL